MASASCRRRLRRAERWPWPMRRSSRPRAGWRAATAGAWPTSDVETDAFDHSPAPWASGSPATARRSPPDCSTGPAQAASSTRPSSSIARRAPTSPEPPRSARRRPNIWPTTGLSLGTRGRRLDGGAHPGRTGARQGDGHPGAGPRLRREQGRLRSAQLERRRGRLAGPARRPRPPSMPSRRSVRISKPPAPNCPRPTPRRRRPIPPAAGPRPRRSPIPPFETPRHVASESRSRSGWRRRRRGCPAPWAAARLGKRVVVIDRDAQANGASVRNFGFVTVTGQARARSGAGRGARATSGANSRPRRG